MGMFGNYGPASGFPDNRREFLRPERVLEAVCGQPSLQSMWVPFPGVSSAKACYYQASRAFLEIPPERVEVLPSGGGCFLTWTLSATETAALGGTLIDTEAQATAMLADGSECVSEPVRVDVREPLAYRAGGTADGGTDGTD